MGKKRRVLGWAGAYSAVVMLLAGCAHRTPVAYAPPPAPVPVPAPAAPPSTPVPPSVPANEGAASASLAVSVEDRQFVATHPPIYTEVGVASWYGPPYNKRRGANGEIFDENMLSAAHRTLPMGSLLRVTNLAGGQSTILRVTDRGPFVPGRVLDLSVAASKAIGVWRPGTAEVRIEVFLAPKSIDEGGRWCVQIGAFAHEAKALKLEERLQRKYQTANVIEFTGPTGHWVRIRPAKDDKARAIEIAREVEPEEGRAYLTRID
jgi:rare lipoprotein A